MKLHEFENFRQYDLKECLLNIDEKLKEKLNIELKNPIYSIIYINPQTGISARIVGDSNTIIKDKAICLNDLYQYDRKIDIELLEKSKIDEYNNKFGNILDVLKQDILKTYYNSQIFELREIKKIDMLRNKIHPDIVEAVLFTKQKGLEVLNVQLLLKSDVEDVYAARLLNPSKNDNTYLEGSDILVKYLNQDGEDYLIISGKVNFFEDDD